MGDISRYAKLWHLVGLHRFRDKHVRLYSSEEMGVMPFYYIGPQWAGDTLQFSDTDLPEKTGCICWGSVSTVGVCVDLHPIVE